MPYVDGFFVYEAICKEIAAKGYQGFHMVTTQESAA
jgi:hypothetical protein